MPRLEALENAPEGVPPEGYIFVYYTEIDGVVKLMAKLPDGTSAEVLQ
ncbi:MAG: hypothetical protein IKB22_00635 [Lentisphaeria bacterium]|nr:hypothetical protein [Lentisphaeria bacterium]